jgi:hypothetical protein
MLESASKVVGYALQLNPSDQPQLQQSEDTAAKALKQSATAVGLALQLGQERDGDLELPGRGYSFGRLIDAEADGDLSALHADGLKVARVRLSADDAAGAIDQLVATLGKGSG